MASADDEVEDILRQMARIRVNLHHEMRNVVAGAEAAVDWRSYVRRQPLASLGVAFALGYILIPRRRHSPQATAQAAANVAAERVRESVAEEIQNHRDKPRRSGGILRAAAVAMAPVAWRFAQAYAAHYLENILAHPIDQGDGRPSEPASAPGGQRRF